MDNLSALTSLDLLLIVVTLFIVYAGVYIIIILHRVAHMTRVVDRFAHTIEKFQNIFSIIDHIPGEILKKVSDRMPRKK